MAELEVAQVSHFQMIRPGQQAVDVLSITCGFPPPDSTELMS